jgi:dienelactone hydrolase
VLLLLFGVYAGWLAHRSRHSVSIAPGGPYPVGRATHELADRSRTDELAPVGGTPRVLSIWLWYPAAAGGTPSAYAPGAWSSLHKFGWAQTRFDRIRTGTYDDAPFAAGTFPIVVLMPGLGFAAPQYASLAATLAARGYIVAGVTPTYSANVTVLDGRQVTASAAGDPPDLSGPRGERLVAVWAADARFAAGRVAALLGTHADQARVVYVGHSFGGAASLEACRTDNHCAGAADLDGTPYGPVVTAGLQHPMLLLSSSTDGAGLGQPAHSLMAASGQTAHAYTIRGARHFDFTDYARYWLAAPVRAVLPLGTPRTLPLTVTYLTAFFQTALHGATWQPPPTPDVSPSDMRAR